MMRCIFADERRLCCSAENHFGAVFGLYQPCGPACACAQQQRPGISIRCPALEPLDRCTLQSLRTYSMRVAFLQATLDSALLIVRGEPGCARAAESASAGVAWGGCGDRAIAGAVG
jgi:hypothetical protein